MVNLIEIINNNELLIVIYPESNSCFYNSKKYYISDDVIDKLLSLFASWKYEYGSSNIIDAPQFLINVHDDNNVTSYHGNGKFPSNYSEYLDIIEGVINE